MHRLFGKSKPKAPEPSLDDAQKSIDGRSGDVDGKISKLDEELKKYFAQMKKMKAGPAKTQLQQRALRVLKQKKMYEKQKDTLMQQTFNIDQTKFAQQNIKDTVTVVGAMKSAAVSLKKEMKQVDIDEIEDLHDDMADLMEDADEINEVMGRAYGVPEELDETDLMNELEGLEDEIQQEEAEQEKEEVPSYLLNAATASKQMATQQKESNVKEKDVIIDTDEFGLPKVPQRSLA